MSDFYDFDWSLGKRFSPFGIRTIISQRKILLAYGHETLGLEIRLDPELEDSGRVYIETHERSESNNGKFMESGIWKDSGVRLYGVGNSRSLYVFEKSHLQIVHLFLKNPSYGMTDAEFEIRGAGKGFTIDERKAEEWAEFYIHYRHDFFADHNSFFRLVQLLTRFEPSTIKKVKLNGWSA